MAKPVEIVVENLIEKMEFAGAWLKTWNANPCNGVSNHRYTGINYFLTFFSGYGRCDWYTFKQIQELKAKIKKGERNTPIVFWKFFETEEIVGGETRVKRIPLIRYSQNWNAEQIEGLPEKNSNVERPDIQTTIDTYLKKTGIQLKKGLQASCSMDCSTIKMPDIAEFVDTDAYYATYCHELIHSTSKALGRDTKAFSKEDDAYAFEELVAELGSIILINSFGIEAEAPLNNAAAYVKGWFKKLHDDKKDNAIVKATKLAYQAAMLVLGEDKTLPTED